MRGRLLIALGRDEEGLRDLEQAYLASPGDATLALIWARAVATGGGEDAALRAAEAFTHARHLRPSDADIAAAEIGAWLDAGDALHAVELCSAAIESLGDEPRFRRLRARASLCSVSMAVLCSAQSAT